MRHISNGISAAMEPSDDPKDHPQIIAFPPLIWLVGAVVSVLVHYFAFASRMVPYGIALTLGIVCVIVAPCLAGSALLAMRAAGTNVNPAKPAVTIVRNGPYRFTRNPMYLALCLLQVALGFFLNDWITLMFAVPLVLALHFGVILPEERYLAAKFGEPYLALKREVHRWI
jgi:protein-S-isoprenylcysteine O-methyltransferase Ste14